MILKKYDCKQQSMRTCSRHLNTVSSKMLAQHVFNEICKRKLIFYLIVRILSCIRGIFCPALLQNHIYSRHNYSGKFITRRFYSSRNNRMVNTGPLSYLPIHHNCNTLHYVFNYYHNDMYRNCDINHPLLNIKYIFQHSVKRPFLHYVSKMIKGFCLYNS